MGELTPTGPGADAPDLRPRTGPAPRRRRRNVPALVAIGLVVVGLGIVVFNGLGDATLFFRNADEAVAQRDELDDRRFRLQGLVDGPSVVPTAVGVDFVVTYGGVDVAVSHAGDPPELFQNGIPVVLEGRWAHVSDAGRDALAAGVPTDGGWFFASDRMLVKHTEVYVADHPDRVVDYDEPGDG